MDEERTWQRITESVRILAKLHEIPVPEDLERVSGDPWERNRKRRAALEAFLSDADGVPIELQEASVDEIADKLDEFVLTLKDLDEPVV